MARSARPRAGIVTTVLIRRNRKGELTGYEHVGAWGRWHNNEPFIGTYQWGDRARRLRTFFGFEFEIGERAAAVLR